MTAAETAPHGVFRTTLNTARRCNCCGEVRMLATAVCPACWQEDWADAEVQPSAQMLSWTQTFHAPTTQFEVPYTVALLELDGGQRILGRLEPTARCESDGSTVTVADMA